MEQHAESAVDVLLAVLPFADLKHPSLGVSLLKAHALRLGLEARVSYLNFTFAEWIGRDLYQAIELGGEWNGPVQRHSTEALLGEWFFANVVFDEGVSSPSEYISKFVLPYAGRAAHADRLLQARDRNKEYVAQCVATIQRCRPRLVGLTTTFDQTCACLAVARELKRLPDAPVIVLGGANCEGEMGFQLARSFPYLDYVCTGEGDEAFPALLRRLFRFEDEHPIRGLVQAAGPFSSPPVVRELDTLPVPDFADYFEAVVDSPLGATIHPEVLVETSRGCWWGAKHHCTFCGLNGTTMVYRSKSADRMLEELREISTRYGVQRFQCVDNILDMNYFRTFLPQLVGSGLTLELFYDTKANLKLEHIRILRDARVRSILPGLESFSNPILHVMRKGTTGAQNIQLLRWCEEFGIQVIWTFLFGFPMEPPAEYARMANLIPLLAHLQPPSYCIPVQLDRFSPYFTDSAGLGVKDVRPAEAYRYIFPLPEEDLRRLAYFFDFHFEDERDPLTYAQTLIDEVRRWSDLVTVSSSQQRPRLDVYRSGQAVMITDSRPCAAARFHVLEGLAAEVYVACDSVQTLAGIARNLHGAAAEGDIREVLLDLLDRKLMVEIEGQYISLAVLRNRERATGPAPNKEPDAAPETIRLPLVQLGRYMPIAAGFNCSSSRGSDSHPRRTGTS